jgi:hypothetical protein
VVIADCIFLDEHWASGGAISCATTTSEFHILRCGFIRCSADQNGGGIAFAGRDIHVSRCFGTDCSAGTRSAFCNLEVTSKALGTVEFNESSASSCNGNQGINRIAFTDRASSGLPAVALSLNLTGNYAQNRGTGLGFAEAYLKIARFCQFSSNFPTAVMFLYDGTDKDLVDCLNFFNNTCIGEGADNRGVFAVFGATTIRGCLFRENTIGYLASRFGSAGEFTVSFVNCLFERADISLSYDLTVKMQICAMAPDAAAWDHFACSASPSFDSSSNPSSSAAFPPVSDHFTLSSVPANTGPLNPSDGHAPSAAFSRSLVFLASDIYLATGLRSSGTVLNTGGPPDSKPFRASSDFGPSDLRAITAAFPRSLAWEPSSAFTGSDAPRPTLGLIYADSFRGSLPWDGSRAPAQSVAFFLSLGQAGTDAFPPTGAFEATARFPDSGTFGPTPIRLVPSSTFPGKDSAVEEGSSGLWLGLGLALAIAAGIALAVLMAMFVRRRRQSEIVEESQDRSSSDTNTWVETIHEDDEEFIDYVNPLEASGAGRDDSSAGQFEGSGGGE